MKAQSKAASPNLFIQLDLSLPRSKLSDSSLFREHLVPAPCLPQQ